MYISETWEERLNKISFFFLESLFILVVVFIYQPRPPGAPGFSLRKWAITQVTRLFIYPFNVMAGGGGGGRANDGY